MRTRRASSRPRSTGSARSARARTRRDERVDISRAARAVGAPRAAPARAGHPAAAGRPPLADGHARATGTGGHAGRRSRHRAEATRTSSSSPRGARSASTRRSSARTRSARGCARATSLLGRLDILPTIDGVEPGLLELLLLERRGLPRPQPGLGARRQLTTSCSPPVCFARAGIPHPRTEHLRPHGDVPDIEPPLVVKPRHGSWGVDVFRCDTEEAVPPLPRGGAHEAVVPDGAERWSRS